MRRSAIILLIASLTGLTCTNTSSPVSDKDSKKVELVRSILAGIHFKDIKIDDDFSKKVFVEYLDRIDYNKRLLTQKDVDKLAKFEDKIDDDLLNNRFRLFELALEIITERTNETNKYFEDILAKPFDFNKDETYELDHEKYSYAAGDAELKERWRQSLKYQVISRIYNKMKDQDKKAEESDTVTIKTFAQLEEESREKVLNDYQQWYKRLKKLNKDDRFADYLNAVTSSYDPHTNYFPPKDKENFDISISGRLEGIGATLQEADGYIKVTRIVPGSASYRQGELEAGDVILKVGQAEEDAIDIVDMRLDEAVQLIRGKKGTEVRLTVRKIDGTQKVIPIIRDIVILDETYAKSAIVKDSLSNKKFGYIKLPKFYADFTNSGGRNCSDDVSKEIKKLKQEGVDGIIFDLRDNGGGSLQDVVKMSGFFVEKGPIVQIKARTGDPYVYSDYDRRIQYDGPLVVMVNSLSASASEIFAAAMQDYNRGIILGSASTYGKGTVQRFEALDDYVSKEEADLKPLGSMKLTSSKFYRVNGGATQWKGVIPDIQFPDNYKYIEVGEKELKNSLDWSEITPVGYEKWPLGIPEFDKIMLRSKKRIADDPVFQLVEENAKRFKALRDDTQVSLNYEKYSADRVKEKEEGKKYEDLFKPIEALSIQTLIKDQQAIAADSSKAASFEVLNKNLQKDRYLWEAIHVAEEIKY